MPAKGRPLRRLFLLPRLPVVPCRGNDCYPYTTRRGPDGVLAGAVVFPGAWLVADSGGMAGGDDGAGPGAGHGRRWDVALSFAGAQRDYVGQVAAALKARGVRCFYDEDEQVRLWGTHLAEELPRIYAEESAAVVVFISADYAGRDWTRLERRAALARAVAEAGVYVLPARFDDSELPGLLPDVVTVDLRRLHPGAVRRPGRGEGGRACGQPGGRAAGRGGPAAAGRPLAEVSDPFALEVHRPVQPEDAAAGLPELPAYVPREHDQVLAQVVRAAAGGRSGIAVLVGGSSTGKTRACWEALRLLRDQEPGWRLWHPIDPTRPDAALRELPRIGPRTVVWLNEAQFYLDVADGGLGERVAAGLRELLRDPARAPVLVLATLWPQYWDTLTARPAERRRLARAGAGAAGRPRHPRARRVHARAGGPASRVGGRPAGAGGPAGGGRGGDPVPGRGAGAAGPVPQRAARRGGADQRGDGRPPPGHGSRPAARLPGSSRARLPDRQPVGRPGRGLAGAGPGLRGRPVQGRPRAADPHPAAPGRLSRRQIRSPGRWCAAGGRPGSVTDGPLYRLADYLDQHGRQHRQDQIPPPEFWAAAAAHARPGDQAALGDAAHDRGLYRDAAQLHKNATASGNLRAALYLSHPPDCLRTDPRPAHWAAARARLDDPGAVADLLGGLREAGARKQAAALLARDPAAHVSLDDPGGVAMPAGRPAGGGRGRAGRRAGQPRRRPRLPRRPGRRGRPAGQACGRRARRSRPPRCWPRPAAHVSLDDPRRRGRPAGQAAGGGRGRAGRRAAGP